MNNNMESNDDLNTVAIIGMAGRFPKADSVDRFWQNLVNSVECISFYSDEELLDSGIASEVLQNPDYIKAKGEVGNVDVFDASFFGITQREAEVTDPQHRMLLECAWEALENAGYDSSKYDGSIGVYAGKSMDYYLLLNVYPRIKKEISSGSLQAAIGNDKDSLTTTISYRMNLTGPAITVQTSSSTSLVAVCVACQSLLTYQCDIALAGGITAGPPIKSGYLYQAGGIWSDDGHCRAFDAKSKGFVPGSGMGMVVLKRLEDALADGDQIWAVIKGFAVNNDGSKKVSYAAPSVDAQAEVVAQALAAADVNPETVTYIETHGTGTSLGDPIEMAALIQAYRSQTDKKQYCAVGSAKTNIGHLDNAAGVAGLIKTAMALKHKKIPASLNFDEPNPAVDFENSPFYVNTKLKEWKTNGFPRRAGVTSLGMGGTNAHVILEEAPEKEESMMGGREQNAEGREYQLLLFSAKTRTALDKMTENFAGHLKNNPANLADAAYTLALGRRDFEHRRAALVQNLEDAVPTLETLTAGRAFTSVCNATERPVVFLFSGQGSQYVNMGKGLYQTEPIFRANIDRCAEYLIPLLGIDLREMIYPADEKDAIENTEKLKETWLTQPALFIIEYSLAQLWMEWGVKPQGMIGHSIGEFTAACISGCMSLEDALKLVALRGRLMQGTEKGAMLSVGTKESEITAVLNGNPEFEMLSLAAVNSPENCVVSGETGAIEKLEALFDGGNVFHRRLWTSHAFHSRLMEPILEEFAETVSRLKLSSPKIPFISGVTGTWIRDEEARDPNYWKEQLRKPVRFSDGIAEILKDPNRILLEVGPGNSLCLLAQKHAKEGIFSSLRHVKQTDPDMLFLQKNLCSLWLSGVDVDWRRYYKDENRQRIPLPTYPFERKRYWLEEVKVKEEVTIYGTDTGEESSESTEAVPEQIEETREFQPRPQLNNKYMAPTTPIEESVARIWEDILGIKPVGIEDNFFDLGGHSLLATLFLSRLQEEFQVRLEMRVIFETPTVSTIARMVEEEQSKAGDTQTIEDIIRQVEGLSNEQVQEALSEEMIVE
jgi:phthiocerol/phenolphthiocerol synthesis type-I polyketide synthase E